MRKTIKAGICLVALMALIVCAGCGAQGENGASSNVSPEKVDIDLTELSSTMVYSEVYNMMNTPDDYVGKTVKMKGTAASFYDDKEKENYYACIIKDATACCSQGLEYTLPEITQTLIITRVEGRTPVPQLEKVRELAKHKTSMAIYLSTGLLKKLEDELKQAGLDEDTPAAIIYKATWPEEERYICTVSSLEETAKKNNIKKTAIVLVGEAIRTVSKDSKAVRSKLYSPDFETEFRKKQL